ALINIRWGTLSPPLILGGLLIVWELPNIVRNAQSFFSKYDLCFLAYIFIAILNIHDLDHWLVVLKTLAYFSCFLAFRFSIASHSAPLDVVNRGAIGGCFLFVVTIIFAFANGSITLSDIYGFSYYKITYSLYHDLSSITSNNEFEGRDIMRNTIAEV